MTADDREALRELLAAVLHGPGTEMPLRPEGCSRCRSALQQADALVPVVEERIRAEKAAAWDEGNEACCSPAYTHLNPYRAALADDREGGGQ